MASGAAVGLFPYLLRAALPFHPAQPNATKSNQQIIAELRHEYFALRQKLERLEPIGKLFDDFQTLCALGKP